MAEHRYDEDGRRERPSERQRRLGGPSSFHYRRLAEGRVERWKQYIRAEQRRAQGERIAKIVLIALSVAVLTILIGMLVL